MYLSRIADFDVQSGRSEHMLFLDLAGPLCLRDAAGTDLTPKARKAQGLLALIGTAPRLRRSRGWLQDKLWSDRGPEQGAASLRQCLTGLRTTFGPYVDCLRTEAGWVALDPERVQVRTELEPGSDAEFLEGLDIRDPEFEHWLRDQRMLHSDRGATDATGGKGGAACPRPAGGSTPEGPLPRPVRFLAGPPTEAAGEDNAASGFVLDRVKRSLLDCAVDLAAFYESEHLAVVALASCAGHLAFADMGRSNQAERREADLALEALQRLFRLHGIQLDLAGHAPFQQRLASRPRSARQASVA